MPSPSPRALSFSIFSSWWLTLTRPDRAASRPTPPRTLVKLKKDVLAAEAEQRLKGTGWLPAMLRSASPVAEESEPEAIAAE